MKVSNVTACVQVRNDFGECFDFYTEKLGLVPIDGDRNGPFANFSNSRDGEPFFSIHKAKDNSEKEEKSVDSSNTESTATLAAVFHTNNFENVYNNWLEAGVQFAGKEVMSGEGYSFNIAYFSDTEGNMLSLEDGGV